MKDVMLGKRVHTGPGGRDCPCCTEGQGKGRRALRIARKRKEKQAWARSLNEFRY